PRDGVGDRAFEALTRTGVADLPRRALGRRTAEPGRKRRVVGPNRQLALVNEVELSERTRRRGRRRLRSRLLRAAAAAGRDRGQQSRCSEEEGQFHPHRREANTRWPARDWPRISRRDARPLLTKCPCSGLTCGAKDECGTNVPPGLTIEGGKE